MIIEKIMNTNQRQNYLRVIGQSECIARAFFDCSTTRWNTLAPVTLA